MKNASKILVVSALSAVLGWSPPLHAGPMGPSARMAARLKKYPTSSWLAHYLPDDRYKIAGGVWKYVSTDLDTYYHRPDSPLMLRQPAGRVIGFSSTKEAEEAGYVAGPSVQKNSGPLDFTGGMTAMAPGKDAGSAKIARALSEIRLLGSQMQNDRTRNLPLMKQRLQRVIVLLDTIPVTSRDKNQAAALKGGLRGLVTSIDLVSQGNSVAARQQLGASLALLQSANKQRRK